MNERNPRHTHKKKKNQPKNGYLLNKSEIKIRKKGFESIFHFLSFVFSFTQCNSISRIKIKMHMNAIY